VQAVLNRRAVLPGVGLGALGLGLAACGDGASTSPTATQSSGEIPDETAGPYPGDGSNGPDVLEESGIIRSDIRAVPALALRHRPSAAQAVASSGARGNRERGSMIQAWVDLGRQAWSRWSSPTSKGPPVC
jgi:hypothetical protein